MNRLAWPVGLMILGMLAGLPCRGQEVAGPTRDASGSPPPGAPPAVSPAGRIGLVLPTPYVRGKIPVIMIHGLWMNTSAWEEMIATLRADRTLDDRFQFWTFGYATGDPIPIAAVLFRRSLDEARRRYDPDRTDAAFDRTVLIGHSMGGLLAKMMVVASGDRLWQVISSKRAEDLRGRPDDVRFVREATSFAPRPEVGRVIFIATPHRGSRTDSGSIRALGNRLLRITDSALGIHRRLVDGNEPGFFRGYFADGLPSSVEELQVDGPFLTTLASLPVAPGIPAHSIIAVRPESPAQAPTDGLVTVESARVAGVASEKVVACSHLLCLQNAEVADEIRRLLNDHLAAR